MIRLLYYILFLLLILFLIIIIPIGINEAYNIDTVYYTTNWKAKDVFTFYGSILTFLGTISLGALTLYQNSRFKKENDKNQEVLNNLRIEQNEKNILKSFIDIEFKRVENITTCIDDFIKISDINSINKEVNGKLKFIYNLNLQIENGEKNADLSFAEYDFLSSLFERRNLIIDIDLKLMNSLLLDKTTDSKIIDRLDKSRIKSSSLSISCIDFYIDEFKRNANYVSCNIEERIYKDAKNTYTAAKENYLAARNNFLNELIYGNISLKELKEKSR